MWGNSGLAEELLASQEELSSGVVRLFLRNDRSPWQKPQTLKQAQLFKEFPFVSII